MATQHDQGTENEKDRDDVYKNLARQIQLGDNKISAEQFLRKKHSSQKKILRLYTVLKNVPAEFTVKDVYKDLKDLGLGDVHRYLNMLVQGEFLNKNEKEEDSNRLIYRKTEKCNLQDHELAAEVYKRRNVMRGYDDRDKEENDEEEETGHRPLAKAAMALEAGRPARSLEADSLTAVAASGYTCTNAAGEHLVIPAEFMEMARTYLSMKAMLPNLSLKDFLVMYLRASGKFSEGAAEAV